ncbi:MAG: ABC transporter permease [Chloroflexota bacterium]
MATSVAKLNIQTRKHEVGNSLGRVAMRRLRRDKITLVALSVVSLLTILAILAPVISGALGVSYARTDPTQTFVKPFGPGNHLLGTDDLGRDHLSRLLYAGQVSLSVGFIAALLSLSIGVSLGIITGYYGGVIDDFVTWIISTLNSIPSLFLLLIVAAVLQPSPGTLIIVLGFLGWTTFTRLVRGETFSIREREYILSARAAGASPFRIMFVHILPNLFSIIVISLAIDIGNLILTEAALSFLGLGIKAPTPSWGNMLTNAATYFTKGPFLVLAPGLLIFVTVLCLYVIGDGFRDAFDPQAKDG